MSPHTYSLFLLFSLLVLNIRGLKCSEILNASETAKKPTLSLSPAASSPPPPPAAAAAVVLNSPVFKTAVDSLFSLNLLTSFPEDQEVSEYCSDLLHVFGQRYVELVRCLVPAARPVKVCQSCFTSYDRVVDVYNNISSQMGPGNESCSESLIRGDRLMLVYVLYSNLEDLWQKAKCQHCITDKFPSLTNDTVSFMAALNQTIACFDKYRQGNHTELCKNCTGVYKNLSGLYNDMEKKNVLCIDIEDAMNVTRRLWSKSFNCSFPREETVPVIAVSSFMLFLPIIFYLSSYLHSEQKKRKIIHPRRAKSSNSLMNIQDKLS